MVTDRKVTRGGSVHDPDANKNLIFGDRNAVVTIAYTGFAYIGDVPTDQWIAQMLTGLVFPQGRRGKGAVPVFMTTQYEDQYLGVRIRNLRDRLNEVTQLIPKEYRHQWRRDSFDVLITGFEWNRDEVRPFLATLSKPDSSGTFEISGPDRNWYRPQGEKFPVRTYLAPRQNLTKGELESIDKALCEYCKNHPNPDEVADYAEKLFVETIRGVSTRLEVVGPDMMSILIPPPDSIDPNIRVRYISEGRDRGLLVSKDSQSPVQVSFSPWVISPGSIRAPSVLTNIRFASACGPYQVIIGGPSTDNRFGAMSSQTRRGPEG